MTPPLLVLDLDGTLLDTAPDLLGALNAVLAEDGLPPADRATLARRFGHGARALLLEGYRRAGVVGFEDRLDRLTERFLVHYSDRLARETAPFPGAVAALDRMEAAGIRLAVCTNKRTGLAVPLLEALGLAARFATVAGGDSFPVRKPDPGHLLGCIAAAGGDPAAAVMVGDSDADVLSAKAAGVPVVGVTFGYSPDPMEALGPDAIVDAFDGLDDALASVSPTFAARLGRHRPAMDAS